MDAMIVRDGHDEEYENLAQMIWECALKIHRSLGPGLLENTYEQCLMYELKKKGIAVENQKALPLVYDEVKLDSGYRIDILVANKIVLELKSVESLTEVHKAQILTYLKLSGCKLGFLINFNVALLKTGFKRYVNNY